METCCWVQNSSNTQESVFFQMFTVILPPLSETNSSSFISDVFHTAALEWIRIFVCKSAEDSHYRCNCCVMSSSFSCISFCLQLWQTRWALGVPLKQLLNFLWKATDEAVKPCFCSPTIKVFTSGTRCNKNIMSWTNKTSHCGSDCVNVCSPVVWTIYTGREGLWWLLHCRSPWESHFLKSVSSTPPERLDAFKHTRTVWC